MARQPKQEISAVSLHIAEMAEAVDSFISLVHQCPFDKADLREVDMLAQLGNIVMDVRRDLVKQTMDRRDILEGLRRPILRTIVTAPKPKRRPLPAEAIPLTKRIVVAKKPGRRAGASR